MELKLRFDEEILLSGARRGSSSVFPIHWSHAGLVYPFDDWWDSGGALVAWWMGEVLRLVIDPEIDTHLRFMEGPYDLGLRREGAKLEAWSQDPEVVWSTTMEDLCQALYDAASKIVLEFARLDILPNEQDGLRSAAEGLRRARSRFPD